MNIIKITAAFLFVCTLSIGSFAHGPKKCKAHKHAHCDYHNGHHHCKKGKKHKHKNHKHDHGHHNDCCTAPRNNNPQSSVDVSYNGKIGNVRVVVFK